MSTATAQPNDDGCMDSMMATVLLASLCIGCARDSEMVGFDSDDAFGSPCSERLCVLDDAGVSTCVCVAAVADSGAGMSESASETEWEDESPDEPLARVPIVSAEWTDRQTLVVTVSKYADLGPYRFGLAETGNAGGEVWDGEDCIFGVLDGYDLCHDVPADGVLTLTSVHPDEGGTIDKLEESVTTIANGPRSPGLTYVLIRASDDPDCWTWGHNPQHYLDALGCNQFE